MPKESGDLPADLSRVPVAESESDAAFPPLTSEETAEAIEELDRYVSQLLVVTPPVTPKPKP